MISGSKVEGHGIVHTTGNVWDRRDGGRTRQQANDILEGEAATVSCIAAERKVGKSTVPSDGAQVSSCGVQITARVPNMNLEVPAR